MRRPSTGHYEQSVAGGETVRAFVPNPLPPDPPLDLGEYLRQRMDQTLVQLGRLDSISAHVPEIALLLYAYVRKEAVLSSQIEGTQSSLSDLLLYEVEEVPGVPIDDAVEASNYVAALDHGLSRVKEGFPLSNRLIREVHSRLLSSGRGASKAPGEFRRSQNWLGGTRPGNARYVPPPPERVEECMGQLERFFNDQPHPTTPLLKAALGHVQFETIHPFLDGNGRVGRLLITLQLCVDGVLQAPLLYLSLYLKQHRTRYYELLDSVRREGEWEAWVEFFVDAVYETASDAIASANTLVTILRQDRERIRELGRPSISALKVHECLSRRPLSTIGKIRQETGLSFPAVGRAIDALVTLDIVREMTGHKRNRVFAYTTYLQVMSKGTERP